MLLRDLQPNVIEGQDCFHLSVSNMLRYKGYLDYLSVWKQCGLFYTKPQSSLIGQLFANYMPRPNELKWCHNVEMATIYFDSPSQFLDELLRWVNRQEPILVNVDAIAIGSSRHFSQVHHIQSMTIVDASDRDLTVLSDIERFKGTIEKECLLRAVGFDRDIASATGLQPSISLISVTNTRPLGPATVLEVVQRNIRMLEGLGGSELALEKELVVKHGLRFGMSSIDALVNELTELINRHELSSKSLAETSVSLYKVSNQHLSFARFLKEVTPIIPALRNLTDLFANLGRQWSTSSQIAYKASLTRPISEANKLVMRLKDLADMESRAIDYASTILPTS